MVDKNKKVEEDLINLFDILYSKTGLFQSSSKKNISSYIKRVDLNENQMSLLKNHNKKLLDIISYRDSFVTRFQGFFGILSITLTFLYFIVSQINSISAFDLNQKFYLFAQENIKYAQSIINLIFSLIIFFIFIVLYLGHQSAKLELVKFFINFHSKDE